MTCSQFKQFAKVGLVLIGWVITQAAAVEHNTSLEHWQSSGHEICLFQAMGSDDDLACTSLSYPISIVLSDSLNHSANEVFVVTKSYLPHQSRAPPFHS